MLKILVVDDSAIARKRVVNIISNIEIPYTIVGEADDGKDGFEKYYELKPNIILTDLEMPNMDGLELIVKIREVDLSIPIIVISAMSNEQVKQTLKHDKFLDLVKKPIDEKKLKSLLLKVAHNIDKKVHL